MKVGILDYGVGNLGSLFRCLSRTTATPIIINNPRGLYEVDKYILPGVGSFAKCKALLDQGEWTQAIKNALNDPGKSLLGICLGMQLLADVGYEGTDNNQGTPGLQLIPGRVCHISSLGCNLLDQHIGWNDVRIQQSTQLLNHVGNSTDFYFAHSYAFEATVLADVVATVNYGAAIAAVVQRKNVMGVQFHPEKSSVAGLRLLQNYVGEL